MKNYNIMDKSEIINFINCNNTCVLAMNNYNCPYAVPMYYDVCFQNDRIFFIMKSKSFGKKMHYMNNNENVCLVIWNQDTSTSVIVYGIACCENSNCYNETTLKVKAFEITGRKFYC